MSRPRPAPRCSRTRGRPRRRRGADESGSMDSSSSSPVSGGMQGPGHLPVQFAGTNMQPTLRTVGMQRGSPSGSGSTVAPQPADTDVDRAVVGFPIAVARVHQQWVARQGPGLACPGIPATARIPSPCDGRREHMRRRAAANRPLQRLQGAQQMPAVRSWGHRHLCWDCRAGRVAPIIRAPWHCRPWLALNRAESRPPKTRDVLDRTDRS